MITYEKKDITTTKIGVIAHGVNCQQTMGSGVALALFTKWPTIRESYMRHSVGNHHLGTVDFVDVTEDKEQNESIVVANCWTQEFFGNGLVDGNIYANVDAIAKCLSNVYYFAEAWELPVVMPKIGCGLAGLQWHDDVEPIVKDLDEKFNGRVNTTVCLWG